MEQKMGVKAVLFDVDGTLLNTTEGVMSSVRYTIEHHGLTMLQTEELLTFIGPPIHDSFARAYGFSGDKLQELATTFRNHYKGDDLYKAFAYDGIYEVCDALKQRGITMAIATYKRQDYAQSIMRHFGFDKYTDIIYGADHENRLKKVDIIRKCMAAMNVEESSDAVMVGDSDNDAIGALGAGMRFLGVTYGFGFHERAEIMKFDHAIGCAASPTELLTYLIG